MKKLMIASAIAMTMAAGSAMANTGDVKFFGNVSEITCDLTPEVGGNVINTIQLGTVAANGTGEDIPFTLKAKSNAGGCASLTGKTADVTWSGPLTDQGFANQGGLANGAYVAIKTVNGKTSAEQAVNASQSTVAFDAAKATTDGFQFKAKLHGGDTAGDFQTAAAYAVTYK